MSSHRRITGQPGVRAGVVAVDWPAVVGSWQPNQFREHRAPTVAGRNRASPTDLTLVGGKGVYNRLGG